MIAYSIKQFSASLLLTLFFGVGVQKFFRLWVGQPAFDRYVVYKITHNVLRLCAGGALKHESFNPPLNFNRITNDEFSRKPHLHKTDVRRSVFGRLPYNDGKANRQFR